jgi:hypothetical protein
MMNLIYLLVLALLVVVLTPHITSSQQLAESQVDVLSSYEQDYSYDLESADAADLNAQFDSLDDFDQLSFIDAKPKAHQKQAASKKKSVKKKGHKKSKKTKKSKKSKKGKKGKKGKKKKKSKASKRTKKVSQNVPASHSMDVSLQDDGTLLPWVQIESTSKTVSLHADGQAKSFQRAKELGVNTLRAMLYTHYFDSCVDPAIRAANQQKYESFVRGAVAQGFNVHLTLTGVASSWGKPTTFGGNCGTANGIAPKAKWFAEFVRTWIPHFYDLGARRFSLWNEPNHPAFLCTKPPVVKPGGDIDKAKCACTIQEKARLFTKLYKAGYSQVKKLRKEGKLAGAVILAGELSSGSDVPGFIKALKGIEADGFALHPYQYCTSPTTKKAQYWPGSTCKHLSGAGAGMAWLSAVKKHLRANKAIRTPAGHTPPLYLTEFGYHRRTSNAAPEEARCKWIVEAMEVAKKNGVKSMLLYHLQSSANPATTWDTGLIDANAQPYCSFIELQKWMTANGYKTQPIQP